MFYNLYNVKSIGNQLKKLTLVGFLISVSYCLYQFFCLHVIVIGVLKHSKIGKIVANYR